MSLDEPPKTLWGAASPPLLVCYGSHLQIEDHCQDTAAGGLAGGFDAKQSLLVHAGSREAPS